MELARMWRRERRFLVSGLIEVDALNKEIIHSIVNIITRCEFVEFFGKVKNKAGDMEKILKEKDKHGLICISLPL